jgi:thiol:disulfide interchange protein
VAGRPAAVPLRARHVDDQHRLLFAWGKPDLKPVLVAYLGLILQGGCLLAIGTFISTTTKNQIVAGGVTFFVCLLLWLLSWFTAFDSTVPAQVVNYLRSSPTSRTSVRACSIPRTWSSISP